MVMSDFFIGMILGLAIGISIGLCFIRQKPWYELTDEEKQVRKLLVGIGVIMLVIGVLVNLWFFVSW